MNTAFNYNVAFQNKRWLNSVEAINILESYIEEDEFTTAAGLRANRKINLDSQAVAEGRLFDPLISATAGWLLVHDIEVVTAVPHGGNRFMAPAARLAGLPYALFTKDMHGRLSPGEQSPGGLKALYGSGKKGIGEDVSSTRTSIAQFAGALGLENVLGLSMVDSGYDYPGVSTLTEAREFSEHYPELPPAHIDTGFACDALIKYPLGLWVHQAKG